MKEDMKIRMRLKFSRTGAAARLSHLEQIRELRRMAESSGLPCSLGKCGKARIARMSFGPAVSVGYESLCEYADLYLSGQAPEAEVFRKISAVSGGGISLLGVRRIPRHFPSIEALVNVAEYEISGGMPSGYGHESIKGFLESREIVIAKKKPNGVSEFINARPLIISMEMKTPETLRMLLRFGPKRNVKPERVFFQSMGLKDEGQCGDSRGAGENASGAAAGWSIKRVGLYWENASGQLIAP